MAIFDLSNAAGRGFNMSSTDSQGWVFGESDPNITTQLVYIDGSAAVFNVYGSAFADQFAVGYAASGDQVIIDDLVYARNGEVILTINDLNLFTLSPISNHQLGSFV
jgi:hypothetical protein